MSPATRNFTRLGVVAAVLVAASCSSRNPQALTVGSASPPASATLEAPQEGAGRLLSQTEAEAALLSASDIGADWTVSDPSPSPSGDGGDESTTASDPNCQPFIDTLSSTDTTWGLGTPAVEAEANYSQQTGDAFSVTQATLTVDSYATTVDTGVFRTLSGKFATCNRFTTTDSMGVTTTVEVFPVSLANYGDATFAIRLQISQGFFTVIAEIASVAVGHNLTTVSLIGLGGLDLALLPRLTESAVARLEDSATS